MNKYNFFPGLELVHSVSDKHCLKLGHVQLLVFEQFRNKDELLLKALNVNFSDNIDNLYCVVKLCKNS